MSSGATPNHHQPPPPPYLRRGISSFHQLNALAVAVVLSASGLVAIESFALVIFSFFYMYFLSKVAFPTTTTTSTPPRNHPDHHRHYRLYSLVGTAFGLLLPVAYIFEGIVEGDKQGIKAATPHVFLLSSQVVLEGVACSDRFSLPMRVLVPVVYNSTRIFSLMEWVRSEVSKVEHEFHGSHRRLLMGRVLAVANLVYWSFNLFGVLLPFCVPIAFKRYYSDQKNVKD